MFLLNSTLFLSLFSFVIIMLYFPLNRLIKQGRKLRIPFIDDKVPFVSLFVIPYLLYFPLIIGFLYAMVFMPILEAQRAAFALIFNSVVCYVFFIFIPTQIEEYRIQHSDFFSRLVAKIHKHDKRFNAFPSGHVSYSLICLLFALSWSHIWGVTLLPLVFMIFFSTVFIKQHYVPDILGGLASGSVSFFLALWLIQ